MNTPEKNRFRRVITRLVFSFALIATLIALFYTEENWRGRRAWKKYKQEMASQGVSMEWKDYIPPPVPDDQNFFGAPNMQDWFTGRGSREISHRMDSSKLQEFLTQRGSGVVADVTIVTPDAKIEPANADIILTYKDGWLTRENAPILRSDKPQHVRVEGTVQSALKRLVDPKVEKLNQFPPEPYLTDVNLQPLGRDPLKKLPPLRIAVRATTVPDIDEVREFFGDTPAFKSAVFGASRPAIATGSNMFRVQLSPSPYIPAADFLTFGDQFSDDLTVLRDALKRPYSRPEGDYTYPFSIPIPNFVTLRMVAQFLALRAQSYLILGKPDKALTELTLLNQLEHVCDEKPTGKPMTLISAMINVAVKGLYVSTMSDGLRMRVWNDSQLTELQSQLSKIDLIPMVHNSFQFETLAITTMAENPASVTFSNYFSTRGESFWRKITNPFYIYIKILPRGWLYQNAVVGCPVLKEAAENFDLTNLPIHPGKVDAQNRQFEEIYARTRAHFSPYSYLANLMIPNFINVAKSMSKNQTLVNEAYVVCGLERYRLIHGRYPETLDELVPRFAKKLPKDMIGGEPLKYRLDGDKFVLYSIGWNEKDDGGIPAFTAASNGDVSKNDWVWPYQETPKK